MLRSQSQQVGPVHSRILSCEPENRLDVEDLREQVQQMRFFNVKT
jgi:hypothetical protein